MGTLSSERAFRPPNLKRMLSTKNSSSYSNLKAFSSPEPRILWLRMNRGSSSSLPQPCAKEKSSGVEIDLKVANMSRARFRAQGHI